MGSILLGLLLVALGAVLMARQWTAWRRDERRSAHARQFARRQFQRRMRVAGLLVLLGVFFLLDRFVADPYWRIAYWGLAALVVMWLIVLAAADVLRTREHFARASSEFLAHGAALREQIERLPRDDSDGREPTAGSQQHDGRV